MPVRRLSSAVVVLILCATGSGSVSAHAAEGPQVSRFTIGTSVRDRPITVVHRAYAGATKRLVVIGDIHGDEQAGQRVVKLLGASDQPRDLDLWLIRTVNPDGVAADRRTNDHGVDLNRNWPYRWRNVGRGTSTWSGPRPMSEPESRALRRFIARVKPALVVTFHQPLFGVGANDKGMPFVRALAAGMRLPVRTFHCTGICHGSFASWVNARTTSTAVTVEFGRTVSTTRIHRAAQTLQAVGSTL